MRSCSSRSWSTTGWTRSSSPTNPTRCASSCQRSRRGCAKKLNHSDLVALLKDGVGERGGRWADLGAGEGNFTRALADLLGPEAQIIAVDKDRGAMRSITGNI